MDFNYKMEVHFFFWRKWWKKIFIKLKRSGKKNKHSEKDEKPFFRTLSGFHVYISQLVYQFDMKSYKLTKKMLFTPNCLCIFFWCVFFSWKSSVVIHSFDLRVVFFFRQTTFSFIHSIFCWNPPKVIFAEKKKTVPLVHRG